MAHWKVVNCILLSRRVLDSISLRIQQPTWDLHLEYGAAVRTASETLYREREASPEDQVRGISQWCEESTSSRTAFASQCTSKCVLCNASRRVSSSGQSAHFVTYRRIRFRRASGYRVTIIAVRNLSVLRKDEAEVSRFTRLHNSRGDSSRAFPTRSSVSKFVLGQRQTYISGWLPTNGAKDAGTLSLSNGAVMTRARSGRVSLYPFYSFVALG